MFSDRYLMVIIDLECIKFGHLLVKLALCINCLIDLGLSDLLWSNEELQAGNGGSQLIDKQAFEFTKLQT